MKNMVSCNAASKATMLSMGSLELLLRASVFTVLNLVVMSNSCGNACKLSPLDSFSNAGAMGIYKAPCSNDLLITDAAPICVSDLLPVLYFEGQMRV